MTLTRTQLINIIKEELKEVYTGGYRYPLRTISPDDPTPNQKLSPEDSEFNAILSMIEDFDQHGQYKDKPEAVIAKVNEIYATIQEMGYSFYQS